MGNKDSLEIERKYLLSGLPELSRAKVFAMRQGYLPGKAIIERVRHVEQSGKSKYFRTIKTGRGLVRVELEEEIDAKFFAELWRLTRGRRVVKRRYKLGRFEIDEFLDRKLVLAEVELKSAKEKVALPAWLEPHVVREVTTESRYVNANLAR